MSSVAAAAEGMFAVAAVAASAPVRPAAASFSPTAGRGRASPAERKGSGGGAGIAEGVGVAAVAAYHRACSALLRLPVATAAACHRLPQYSDAVPDRSRGSVAAAAAAASLFRRCRGRDVGESQSAATQHVAKEATAFFAEVEADACKGVWQQQLLLQVLHLLLGVVAASSVPSSPSPLFPNSCCLFAVASAEEPTAEELLLPHAAAATFSCVGADTQTPVRKLWLPLLLVCLLSLLLP